MSYSEYTFNSPTILLAPEVIINALVDEGHELSVLFDDGKRSNILSLSDSNLLDQYHSQIYVNAWGNDSGQFKLVNNLLDLVISHLSGKLPSFINSDNYFDNVTYQKNLEALKGKYIFPKVSYYDGDYLVATVGYSDQRTDVVDSINKNFNKITKFIGVQHIASSAFLKDVIDSL